LESIDLSYNELNDATNDTKKSIAALLQEVPPNQFSVNKLDLSKCKLTTGTFTSIVGLLKFVNEINLSVNQLNCEALPQIVKVN